MKTDNPNRALTEEDINDLIMTRGDKSMLEMMKEKPSGRWSPQYWHPDFEKLLEEMGSRFEPKPLGDFIDHITYGQVGKRVYSPTGKVRYIQTINLTDTGIDYDVKEAWIEEGSHNDLERSRLQYEDLLLGNAGMGGLGKCVLFMDEKLKVNISQDIDLLRVKGISSYYVAVFLKTEYGNTQIWRRARGVGAPKLPFDEIRAISVPATSSGFQGRIEAEYKNMSAYHDKAIEAKKKSDEKEYKRSTQTAEKMLRDLIARTEAVIRGERDDLI